MRLFNVRQFLTFDIYLLAPMAVLIAVSLTILYSLGLGGENGGLTNFYNQLWFLPIGVVILLE